MKHADAGRPVSDDCPPLNEPVDIDLVVDQLNAAVWVFDIDKGRVVWANKAALAVWLAGSRAELFARDMQSDMSPAVARRLRQYQNDFVERNASFTEMWTIYPQGMPRPMRVRFSGIRLPGGRMGMLCDGTEDAATHPEVLRSIDALLHTQLMIALHRQDGETLYMNPAARAKFDANRPSLTHRIVNRDDYERLVKEVHEKGETRLITRVNTSSGVKWHELTARACLDPVSGMPSMLVSESDVSELKEAEARAHNMARQDPLTQLPNRLALPAIFARLRGIADVENTALGVFFIDLDQFKAVNDTLGHYQGDRLLTDVAQRLSRLCGPHDAVVRLGVRIALDDFGTGYSNLARLSETAVDCIKIDRSLIQQLPRNHELIQMVIALCRLMKARIVAEGVETAEAASWASRNGCHELQGYLYGRPMPADLLEKKLLG